MTDLQSLLALLQHAEAARDTAQAEHQRALRDNQAALVQQEQLIAYRGEYEQRYSRQFAQGGSMDIVRCYQSFMQRLGQAIEQQRQATLHHEARERLARATLQQHELQVASIRKLIERRTEADMRRTAQREQRLADELASRAASASQGGAGFAGATLFAGTARAH